MQRASQTLFLFHLSPHSLCQHGKEEEQAGKNSLSFSSAVIFQRRVRSFAPGAGTVSGSLRMRRVSVDFAALSVRELTFVVRYSSNAASEGETFQM